MPFTHSDPQSHNMPTAGDWHAQYPFTKIRALVGTCSLCSSYKKEAANRKDKTLSRSWSCRPVILIEVIPHKEKKGGTQRKKTNNYLFKFSLQRLKSKRDIHCQGGITAVGMSQSFKNTKWRYNWKIIHSFTKHGTQKMHARCLLYLLIKHLYITQKWSISMTWDPHVMNYYTNGRGAPSALLSAVIILLPFPEKTDIWLIRCETLPPLQMQWQTPAHWLIKNQTDLSPFSFSSGERGGSEQEDISINVSLNLLSHWRVFGGLTFLISQLFFFFAINLSICICVWKCQHLVKLI